jgi:phytoene dehydrogenase-like protein
VIDGCIHWLTGGAFTPIYEELGIVPAVSLATIERWTTYRDAHDETEIAVTRDLAAFARALCALAPEDADEIGRIVEGAETFAGMTPPVDTPPELASMRDQVRSIWEMRDALGAFVHFRKPVGIWAREHLKSERLRRFFASIFPGEAPAADAALLSRLPAARLALATDGGERALQGRADRDVREARRRGAPAHDRG